MGSSTIIAMTDFKIGMRWARIAIAALVCIGVLSCGLPERDVIPVRRDIVDTGIYDLSEIDGAGDQICPPAPLANGEGCWEGEVNAYRDCHYSSLYNRFDGGWTGADATYSIKLPDGRTAWFFGDTFLGTVNPDGTRPGGIPFLNNTVVVTRGTTFNTIYGGTSVAPEAFVKPPQSDDWYWPNDPTLHDGKIQLLLSHMGRTGVGGMWDFQLESTDLVIISPGDFTIDTQLVRVDDNSIFWGAAVMEDEGYTYIYGLEDVNPEKYMHIARVAGGNLMEPWEFYDGSNWISEPSGHRVRGGMSNQFAVFMDNGRYYLLTQESIFGTRIFLYESNTPVGPWDNERVLYCTPESGGDIFTYNAFAHPEQSLDDDLLITYNVNSFEFGDLFEDVNNYRPRFVRIKNWR